MTANRPESRYDILFEPVRIGPVTAPNRFYQVPHCTGMGFRRPNMLAAMRGIKAEGGWGVVCTEYCSIDAASDDGHYPHARLWDEEDVRAQALVAEAIHAGGALAGVELWAGGSTVSNLSTRLPSLGVRSLPSTHSTADPVQSRPMDREDIRDLRRSHVEAARRALRAGFDIVYVYANHGYLLHEFLSARRNDRSDEYGGGLENRARLVREILEDTRELVEGKAAVACRFSLASEEGSDFLEAQESRDLFALLAELPDLWDITIDGYTTEMGSSRYVKEAAQEAIVTQAKSMTTKPVVGVGRFTSPDTMVGQIKRGALDLIGAARPSIADPFLPKKIAEGRLDEIRECIGCNICYAHNSLGVPIRCTQNPTMGEEWRRDWHPERIPSRHADARVLIVGGGPAGLEAARALGQRGYAVTLAEAGEELGGRVSRESRLPGLAEWARVRDWRLGRLTELANVETYLASPLDKEQVLELGAEHVLVATGAHWARDGVGRWLAEPFEGWQGDGVLTPDDLMAGARPAGPVLVYDDDHYYMGASVALHLRAAGNEVTLVTTRGAVGIWTTFTEELGPTNARLLEEGVEVVTNHGLLGFDGAVARLACVFTGRARELPAAAVVPVTRRIPEDALYAALRDDPDATAAAGIQSLQRIGDCDAPSTIAAAVYAGHKAARALGANVAAFEARRERAALG